MGVIELLVVATLVIVVHRFSVGVLKDVPKTASVQYAIAWNVCRLI